MTTKLEAMVGLLAGRKVEPELLDELADPSSEASRFLEATRARSKALLAGPAMPQAPRPTRAGRGGLIAVALLAVAALVAFAMTLRVVDRRFRLLEGSLEARDRATQDDARRLEAILARLAEPRASPDGASLRQIEAGLERLEARAKAAPPAKPPVEEFAAIRRELAAAEQANVRRSEEVQAAIHDAARVIRLLLNRFDPPVEPDKPPAFPPPRPPGNGDPRRPKP